MYPCSATSSGTLRKSCEWNGSDLAIDALRVRFGNTCVKRAVELTDDVMSGLDIKRDNTVHPIGFLR